MNNYFQEVGSEVGFSAPVNSPTDGDKLLQGYYVKITSYDRVVSFSLGDNDKENNN